MTDLDTSRLMESVSDTSPCGENPRENASVKPIYFSLKDARNAARADERATVPGEPIRLSANWQEVDRLATQILTEHSKDIEVLAWLAEARLRLMGYAGLLEVFAAMTTLFRDFWDDLHSIGDGDLEDKVAPLAGLNGIGTDGSLIQPLRLAPLAPGSYFGQHTLWDYQLSQRNGKVDRQEALMEAFAELSPQATAEHHGLIGSCIASYEEVSALLDERCGTEAPPTSKIIAALKEAGAAIRVLAGIEADGGQNAADMAGEDQGDQAAPRSADMMQGLSVDLVQETLQTGESRMPVSALTISTRDEAFQALLTVARYFRRSEPHSPIAASIETLVRRGRMDFADLLAELLPDAGTRRQVLTAAGIQPSNSDDGQTGQ